MLRRVIGTISLSACLATGLVAHADGGLSNEARLEIGHRYFRMAELADASSPIRDVNYAKAEKLARDVIASDPRIAEAHFLLFAARGRLLLIEEGGPSLTNFWKYSDLNKYLARTLELDPHHANALAAKGGILLDLPPLLGGDRETARGLLEQALQLNPTGPGTRVALARALLLDGDRDMAREHLLMAAHYACLKRELTALKKAEEMLGQIESGAL